VKILLVEDDVRIAESLKKRLPTRGFVVDVASTAKEGLALARTNLYALAILDIHLQNETCDIIMQELRAREIVPPILMFTARAEIPSRVQYLHDGADDYMTKPYDFDELVARIRALLRRPAILMPEVFTIGELEVRTDTQTVWYGKKKIYLTRKEFMILEYLLRHRGIIVSRTLLFEHVWDSAADFLSSSLEAHVCNIRKKLGMHDLIQTIHARGYVIN
jgi:two-component system OmpR family response regulator